MNNVKFKRCIQQDIKNVKVLLRQSNLPFEDIDDHYEHFIVATDNNNLTGVIGLEHYSSIGLLRSLAVVTDYQNRGLGTDLVNKMIAYSRSISIKELYLLTTTADTFFKKLGFDAIERNCVPVEIKSTLEFKSICPVSAICMKLEI
jgi:amino-acid N-acetyltransferase